MDIAETVEKTYHHYVTDASKPLLRSHHYFIKSWGCRKGAQAVAAATFACSPYELQDTALIALTATAPLLLASKYYYGAFWSRLSGIQEVQQALSEQPLKTISSIGINSVVGTVYHYPYMARAGIGSMHGFIFDWAARKKHTAMMKTLNTLEYTLVSASCAAGRISQFF